LKNAGFPEDFWVGPHQLTVEIIAAFCRHKCRDRLDSPKKSGLSRHSVAKNLAIERAPLDIKITTV
jgi:hypothetical protein